MSKRLYIFVDSERPDPYFNAVVHCILYENVRFVTFMHILGLPGSDGQATADQKELAGEVSSRVRMLLEGLAKEAKYTFYTDRDDNRSVAIAEQEGEGIAEAVRVYYSQARACGVSYSEENVRYPDLRTRLREMAKNRRDTIVDVTAVKKRYLGDIVAAALLEGVKPVYTFDLPRQDFETPWRVLIHSLAPTSPKREYKYIDIVDTPIFDDCARSILLRRPPLLLSSAVTAVLLPIVLLAYFTIGPDSNVVKVLTPLSAVASMVSLALALFPARER